MMKHSILSSILFAALLLGCSKDAKQNNVTERTIKVQTGTLQEHTFREIFRAQGMVEAARKGTISACVPGRIDIAALAKGSSVIKAPLVSDDTLSARMPVASPAAFYVSHKNK